MIHDVKELPVFLVESCPLVATCTVPLVVFGVLSAGNGRRFGGFAAMLEPG